MSKWISNALFSLQSPQIFTEVFGSEEYRTPVSLPLQGSLVPPPRKFSTMWDTDCHTCPQFWSVVAHTRGTEIPLKGIKNKYVGELWMSLFFCK